MNIFLINLRRNPDRLAAADRQLRALGLDYERIDAVDGTQLTAPERAAAVHAFRWWCAMGYLPRPGQIGCALSHKACWQKLLDTPDAPCACILEDDAVLDPRFPQQLANCEAFLKTHPGAHVLTLAYHIRHFVDPHAPAEPTPTLPGSVPGFGFAPTDREACTEGYILSRDAALSLLRANRRLCFPVDNWKMWVRWHLFSLWHACPPVCRQAWETFPTDVPTAAPPPSRLMRLPHLLLRAFGLTLTRLLPPAK